MYMSLTASLEAPICRVQADRGLLERFASAAEGEEALRVEVRKYEDQNIER